MAYGRQSPGKGRQVEEGNGMSCNEVGARYGMVVCERNVTTVKHHLLVME